MIRVGICSYRKTGNYLLLKILIEIINKNSNFNSLSKKKEIWNEKFKNKLLAYPEELDVDELVYFEKNKWQLYKGKERFDLNNDLLLELYECSNIILTHEPPSLELLNHPIFSKYTWIYLYRDCKETINSLIYFLTSPVILEREPKYLIRDTSELFKDDNYILKKTSEWIDHVNSYQKFKDKFHLFSYDQLTNLSMNLINLINLFNIQIDKKDISNILENSTFENMKKTAPNHVRKGKKNDWLENFNNNQIKLIDFLLEKKLYKSI